MFSFLVVAKSDIDFDVLRSTMYRRGLAVKPATEAKLQLYHVMRTHFTQAASVRVTGYSGMYNSGRNASQTAEIEL